MAKGLRRDILSKILLSENNSKNPSAANKKQALEWNGSRFPSEFSIRLSPAGVQIKKPLEGFCKISLNRVFKPSGGLIILCLQRTNFRNASGG